MGQDRQYVTFGIDRETFAIPVELVQEILDLSAISRLPQAPSYVLGLMEVRGVGMPVVDLRVKFGLEPITPTARTRVIVMESLVSGRTAVGLATDCVFEVTDLGGLDLQPPPSVGRRWRSDCVTGIGRRGAAFVIILDLERLLEQDEALQEVVAA